MFIDNGDGTKSWIPEEVIYETGIVVSITALALSYKQVEALRDLPEDQENDHDA